MRKAETSAPTAEQLRANIWKFYLFRWLMNFQLFLPIWVVYLTDERHLSLTEVTILDTAFWIALVVMEVPTGAIADRYGRKVSMTIGAVANAIALFVFGIGDNYPVIIASYLAWAVAWTLFSGADAAFFYDTLKGIGREHEYQKLFGRCTAIQQTGVLAGVLIGAPLAAWTNLPTPILINAGLMLTAWGVALSFKEPPRHESGPQLSYLAGAKEAGRIIWGSPAIRSMMLLAATIVALAMCVSILQQPFLSRHGVDIANFGWFSVPGNVVGLLGALFAYQLTAKLGVNRVVALMPVITMITAVGLGAWDSIYAYAFYPINGVVWTMSFPVVSDYLNKRIPSSQRATILSVFQLLFSLILAPLEPVVGVVADIGGLPAAYRVIALLVALAVAPLLALWLRSVRNESRGETRLPEAAIGS